MLGGATGVSDPADERPIHPALDTAATFAHLTGEHLFRPADVLVQAEVNEEHVDDEQVNVDDEQVNVGDEQVNVDATGMGTHDDRQQEDADRISLAGSLPGVPPPAGPPPATPPFLAEWFVQVIGAAATAAATAVATASARRPSPVVDASAPRRLNDRKVPDFWEEKP